MHQKLLRHRRQGGGFAHAQQQPPMGPGVGQRMGGQAVVQERRDGAFGQETDTQPTFDHAPQTVETGDL